MSVIRVEKTKNYTVMSNHHLRNKNLSLKAKGLMSVMLSFPDDWDYTVNGLIGMTKEDKHAVGTALKELEELLYLQRKYYKNEKGYRQVEFILTENPRSDFPTLENPTLENPTCENPPQLNTNTTKYLKNKVLNTGGTPQKPPKSTPSKTFRPPELEEVRKYCQERNNNIDPQSFIDHYEATGWMRGKNKIKDWKACMRTWEVRRRNETSPPSPQAGAYTAEDYKRHGGIIYD